MSNEIAKTESGFNLRPRNMEEAMKIATMVSRSCLAPKDFRGKPEDTLVAMMLGNELGLNPMQAIQNIAVVNGRPSIYGDALLALVQNHPAFEGIQESFDDATMTAICKVKRKGGEWTTTKFSQADAQTAGLWKKAGPWTQYPKRMLQMRARGFGLRDQFSDALSGLITREEAMDIPEKEINAREQAPAIEAPLEYYADDKFAANFPTWEAAIAAGRKTADEVISTLSTRANLTDEQENKIKAVKVVGKQSKEEFINELEKDDE